MGEMKFDARGFAAARKRMQAMRARTENVSPAWDALLTWWAARNVTNFRNKGQRWKHPWKPLAPSTLSEKLRLGYSPDILVRTGAMRTSLTVRPLGIERIRPHEVEAGTDAPQAGFHQSGTRNKSGGVRMPARKLVNARQVQQEGVVTAALINWIVDGKKSTRSKKVDG